MLIRLRFLFLLPIAALLGCGSSPTSSFTATPYNFNGTWGAYTPDSNSPDMPLTNFMGGLQVSNGVVTGTLTPFEAGASGINNNNICPADNTPLAVTGTLDADNDLVLTFPIGGGTATLIATLANDPSTRVGGSWQIVGGTCAMSVTGMVIHQVTPTTPTVPTSPVPPTGNLSGNWGAYTIYNYVTPTVTGLAGSLQFTNGSVTGTLNLSFGFATGAACQSYNVYTVPVTGTLDASNNLTLTFPLVGGTGTVTATLGSNPQTLADGSLQIIGTSLCAMAATPITIAQYAPITGTYTGTFNSPSLGNMPMLGTDIGVTAVLTQSTTPNSSGQFPITGTLNVTGSCTGTVTLAPGTVTGGGIWSVGSNADPRFDGNVDPTASTIDWAEFASSSVGCYGEGMLMRQ